MTYRERVFLSTPGSVPFDAVPPTKYTVIAERGGEKSVMTFMALSDVVEQHWDVQPDPFPLSGLRVSQPPPDELTITFNRLIPDDERIYLRVEHSGGDDD